MASTDAAKKQLQQIDQAQGSAPSVPQGQQRPTTVNDLLITDRIRDSLDRALSGVMSTDRFASLVMTVMRGSPQLQQCTPMSVIAAAVQAAQLHLEPGPLGEAYIVPFQNRRGQNRVWEAQFIIGYKGMISLAHRAGVAVSAHAVHEHEPFDFSRGTGDAHYLRHKPLFRDRGEVIAYYGLARWKVDGQEFTAFEVLGLEDIFHIRDNISKSGDGPAWSNNFDSMAKKSTIRRLDPYLPKSVELRRALSADESVRSDLADITPDMASDAWVAQEQEHREAQAAASLPVAPVDTTATEAPSGKCPTCNFDLPEHADGCDHDEG